MCLYEYFLKQFKIQNSTLHKPKHITNHPQNMDFLNNLRHDLSPNRICHHLRQQCNIITIILTICLVIALAILIVWLVVAGAGALPNGIPKEFQGVDFKNANFDAIREYFARVSKKSDECH